MSKAAPFRLKTLGTFELVGPTSTIRAADHPQQRRRLALLAVLASAGERGINRDDLLLLFWPESTQRKARHSLDQLLYALRTSLDESIVLGVDPVRLNPQVITSDVADFNRAVGEGDCRRALELYRGPFLDGFGSRDTREFEEWVQAQRDRLQAEYEKAGRNSDAALSAAVPPRRSKSRLPYYIMAAGIVGVVTLAMAASKRDTEANTIPRERRTTRNVAAYDLYVRGKDPVLLRNDSTAQLGLEYFRQAIQLDPQFAGAWAGLGTMYSRLAMSAKPPLPRAELKRRALGAARRSIALDDSLAEGHVVLGLINSHFATDLNLAEKELEYALVLDPRAANAREYLAITKLILGRPDEALSQIEKEVAVNRHSPSARAVLAITLYALDRCGEAQPILDSLSLMRPPLLRVAVTRGLCYASAGNWSATIRTLAERTADGDLRATGITGLALARKGQRDSAIAIRKRLREAAAGNAAGWFDVGVVSYGLGDADATYAELRRASDAGVLPWEMMGPVFKDLRSDPRFAQIAASHGIRAASR